MPDLLYNVRVYPVEQAGEDHLPRPPDDHEDRGRDQESHDRVGEWVAEPHPYGTGQHGEARPAVGPRVVAVCDERGAAYLPTHPDAEDRHRFVAQEPDRAGERDRPQQTHGLRVDDPLYGLVSGDEGREQDDEHHDHPGQVLHPPVAVWEAPARTEAYQREGDPERHGGG